MKDVQCYELFSVIALKDHAFSFFKMINDMKQGFLEMIIGQRKNISQN